MQQFDVDFLRENLQRIPLISATHIYQSVASTNETARRLAKHGAPGGTLVLADQQTGGRGRLGRAWHSPGGKGLWFSLLLRPQRHENAWGLLPMVLSEILVVTLRELYGHAFAVKWPNDVLFQNRKLCGILCESATAGDALEMIVAGIGINVNQSADEFPQELRASAVSLREVLGEETDRTALLLALLRAISDRLEPVLAGEQELHLQRWRDFCPDFGKRVEISAGNRRISGIFRQVSGLGEMIIEQEHGEPAVVSCGEATFQQR